MALGKAPHQAALRLDALLSTGFLLGILAVVLVVAQQRRERVDLSVDGNATLAADLELSVRSVVDGAQQVTITAFSAQQRDDSAVLRDRQIRDVLAEIDLRSEQIETDFVSFDADPVSAERLGVSQYGTVVVQSGDRRVDLSERELFPVQRTATGIQRPFVGEVLLARALQQVTAQESRVACFVTGHGERSPTDASRGGAAALAAVLAADGWAVRTCDLLKEGVTEVPADVTALWWVAPRMPISGAESEALASYLRRGGGLALLFDTTTMVPDLAEAIGVTVPSGELRDETFVAPYPERPVLQVRPHAVSKNLLDADVRPQLSGVLALRARPVQGATFKPLLLTSQRGWLQVDSAVAPSSLQEVPREVLTAGLAAELGLPHPLGAVDGARVVVVGEGSGNRSFALGIARWIGGGEPPPSLSLARAPVRKLQTTPSQARWAQGFLLGGLPLFTLLMGLWVARARRLL